MRLFFPLSVALLTLVPGLPLASAADTNPCADLKFLYVERIAPQGFLGMTTPKASSTSIQRAIEANIEGAWVKLDWKQAGNRWPQYLEHDPNEHPRVFANLIEMAVFDFRLHELCTQARKEGRQVLAFVCSADTESDWIEEPKRPGDDQRGMNPKGKDLRWMTADCFLSTPKSTKPSWTELEKTRWGKGASNEELRFASLRDDGIKNEPFRRELYTTLLRHAVNRIVEDGRLPASAPRVCPNCNTPVRSDGLAPLRKTAGGEASSASLSASVPSRTPQVPETPK